MIAAMTVCSFEDRRQFEYNDTSRATFPFAFSVKSTKSPAYKLVLLEIERRATREKEPLRH